MTRETTLAIAVLLLCVAADWVQAPDAPNDALTPGAVASTDTAEVCGRVDGLTYSRRHRVWHDKAGTLTKYGLPLSDMRLVEDDDRVPVCAGGDNADPRNHWPQLLESARQKDRLEADVCREICHGEMSLRDGQALFLAPADWRQSYQRVFGEAPR